MIKYFQQSKDAQLMYSVDDRDLTIEFSNKTFEDLFGKNLTKRKIKNL